MDRTIDDLRAALPNLTQRGIAIIPRFLTEQELALIRQDYADPAHDRFPGADYPKDETHAYPRRELVARLEPKLLQLATVAAHVSSVHVDMIANVLYADTGILNVALHTDRWPAWLLQDPSQYLHVWVPFVKPDPEKSGLAVLPLDNLARAVRGVDSSLVASMMGPLAQAWSVSGIDEVKGQTEFLNATTGATFRVDVDIREYLEFPPLQPGDALVWRNDVIHGTQDVDTRRVAIDFRLAYSQGAVSWEAFWSGGMQKLRAMAENERVVARVLAGFLRSGKHVVSIQQAHRWMSEASDPDPRALQILQLMHEMIPASRGSRTPYSVRRSS